MRSDTLGCTHSRMRRVPTPLLPQRHLHTAHRPPPTLSFCGYAHGKERPANLLILEKVAKVFKLFRKLETILYLCPVRTEGLWKILFFGWWYWKRRVIILKGCLFRHKARYITTSERCRWESKTPSSSKSLKTPKYGSLEPCIKARHIVCLLFGIRRKKRW